MWNNEKISTTGTCFLKKWCRPRCGTTTHCGTTTICGTAQRCGTGRKRWNKGKISNTGTCFKKKRVSPKMWNNHNLWNNHTLWNNHNLWNRPKDVEQAQRGGTGPKRWNRPKDQPHQLSILPRFARLPASRGSPLRGVPMLVCLQILATTLNPPKKACS